MILVHPDDIVIPENRFRREFNQKDLDDLRESILRNGLLHPPVVERNGDTWILRAGERRLRVLKEITSNSKTYTCSTEVVQGLIAVTEMKELNELQRLEIEVEENVLRKDFTWQERDKAYAALHELRSKQNPGQTIAATATEILGKPAVGSQQTAVSDALIRNKYMHIPEVAKAKNEKEALKAIRKIADAGHRAKLAQAALVQKSPHILIKGDSQHVLSTLPAGSFDVIVSDPPYGVNADGFGEMASTGHDYEDSKKRLEEILQWLPDELARVAKERAHCYLFCDIRWFDRISTLMLLAGWTPFPTPLIWHKSNGMLPFPDHGPRRNYECIFYAWRGDRKVLTAGRSDVIDIPSVRKPLHGAQKPVALYQDLLSRSANPGDRVLDMFGGTGPILVAANRLGLVATYVEDNENSFNIAQTRKDTKEIDDGAEEQDGLEDVEV